MKNLIIKTFNIAIILICASVTALAAPPLATIQEAKDMVEAARYQLPVDLGNGMTLSQLDYDSKTYSLVYRYHYYIPAEKPSLEAINETKQGLIHFIKAQPNSEDMRFLKDGISFHYNYYASDGTFVYDLRITPEDITSSF